MGKGKNRRIADHRNEGFTPRHALWEHNKEKTSMINKQIITKQGLKMYTDDEVASRSGAVSELNYNLPYSWDDFKAFPEQNKREYICHLCHKYKGLKATDIAEMFGLTNPGYLASILRDLGVNFTRGGAIHTEGRYRFRKDMLSQERASLQSDAVEQSHPEAPYTLQSVCVICDTLDASDVLKRLGLSGKIYITATAVEEGEVE